MRVATVVLNALGPFERTTLSFLEPQRDGEDETSSPRPMTVVFGGDGTGKTTLLGALSVTRPGYALPPLTYGRQPDQAPPHVVVEWLLGDDDPERPHPLLVASPSAILDEETPERAASRRKEQAIFDRKAQLEGGFVFVAFSGARWFSRAQNLLTTPEKTILRYDVRQPPNFDDPTRADLTRETKQVLSYAAVARSLGENTAEHLHLTRFDEALREVVAIVLEPFSLRYSGVSPRTLEPEFRDVAQRAVTFDSLPRPARHLVSFVVLSLRALAAANPSAEDPREREGVVAIDDIENQQDPATLGAILSLLRRALPSVQWIVTTSSTALAMACDPKELLSLRKSEGHGIEIGEGTLH